MSGSTKKKKSLTETELTEIQILARKNPAIKKLLDIYTLINTDPNETWKAMIIHATTVLRQEQLNNTLDVVDDNLHKSLWELLKGGATVAKTLSSTNEVKPKPEKGKSESEMPVTDQDSPDEEGETILVITAETAGNS